MTQSSEERFLALLKQADSPELVPGQVETYEEGEGDETAVERTTEAVVFSDAAQDSNKQVKEEVPKNLLESKDQTLAVERALVGNILPVPFETSSINLKPVEKISSPTLMERVLRTTGRV